MLIRNMAIDNKSMEQLAEWSGGKVLAELVDLAISRTPCEPSSSRHATFAISNIAAAGKRCCGGEVSLMLPACCWQDALQTQQNLSPTTELVQAGSGAGSCLTFRPTAGSVPLTALQPRQSANTQAARHMAAARFCRPGGMAGAELLFCDATCPCGPIQLAPCLRVLQQRSWLQERMPCAMTS